jgi:hypothetical protein
VKNALTRSGLLKFLHLDKIAREMCQYDDILIGLDTTCFYHSAVTTSILDSFVGVAKYPYLDTPNWTTIVASVISTGEIEHKASSSKIYTENCDNLSAHARRSACRAIQEFKEISSCKDLEGVAILLTGEIPPNVDFSGNNTIRDELIRRQIKSFLGDIGFHKGIYFLTADRMCAMFALAGGLHAIHLTRGKIPQKIYLTNLFQHDHKEGDIQNVSELLYELGVEFPLQITFKKDDTERDSDSFSGLSFILQTDWVGKSLQDWEDRSFKIKFTPKESQENLYEKFLNCLLGNANNVKLGQLLWGWQQVNNRHSEGN